MMASGVLKSIHDNRQHKLGHEQHQKGRQGTLVLLAAELLLAVVVVVVLER